ncbi:RHS repeat-associated core domain-containing protein [Treponema sp. OMZ 791]|uniref:RHS repeat-associated core domain-containing protein n=1 Tax=unclassified Treponema TaxID=2638727 RepID=UPI002201C50F|nr:hypothetical protein E4O06_11505 [Treponema sp. OMZ 789]UTC71236.1 hypothetical protein E4O01_11645 [Treponema sp. OMZ 790]UTC73954.1 hypothetical protein E4O02_11740 [Treponema sp. OMZ 791]
MKIREIFVSLIFSQNIGRCFLYQCQHLAAESELAYNRYRYYAPSTGTYISRDTIGQAGGNPALFRRNEIP